MPQSRAITSERERHATSSGNDLLYAADLVNGAGIYIFTFPAGTYSQYFVTPGGATVTGMCSNGGGTVFVTAYTGNVLGYTGYIYEYAHGATSPSATVDDGDYAPFGCSVDPANGNLAVANFYSNSSGNPAGDVAVFPDAQGPPTSYTDSALITYDSPAYDNVGNLFILGNIGAGRVTLVELPNGSSTFTTIILPRKVRQPNRLQWSGKYLAVLGGYNHAKPRVYRVEITGSSARFAGITKFSGMNNHAGNAFCIQSGIVVVPSGISQGQYNFGIWKYPSGGDPLTTVEGYDLGPMTVSVGSSH
jgi:hypothetical protein